MSESLIDAARRLAEAEPIKLVGADGVERWQCTFCEVEAEAIEPLRFVHASDCPWLSMTRIVAALEAAERVIRDGNSTYQEGTYVVYLYDWKAWQALVAALGGEGDG